MVIVTRYTVEYDEAQAVYKIRNLAPPFCPDCAVLLSGYDTRARNVIDSSGTIKPGQTIDTIEILRSLEVGTYEDVVLQYDCYTLEGLQPLNGSKTVLNLEVIP